MRAGDVGAEFLTCREAARQAGVATETMRRWIVGGRFPRRADGSRGVVVTPGGQYRLFREVVDTQWPTK